VFEKTSMNIHIQVFVYVPFCIPTTSLWGSQDLHIFLKKDFIYKWDLVVFVSLAFFT
jgi:hypothetical protein